MEPVRGDDGLVVLDELGVGRVGAVDDQAVCAGGAVVGAEELAVLNGRFELGVGISWNTAEYQALNVEFSTRGRRLEEQIEVLRRLWSEPFVTFKGRFHTLDGVGLNRVPAQPIPIWIGASSEPAIKRATKIADGFLPLRPLDGGRPGSQLHCCHAQ